MKKKKTTHFIRFVFKSIWLNISLCPYFFVALLPHPKVRKGDRFRAITDIETTALAHFKAPFTDGFNCTIPKGSILIATRDSFRPSLGFQCVPENYNEFQEKFVPSEIRDNYKYAGYSFVFKYGEIKRSLERI